MTARVCTRCHGLSRIYVTRLDAPVRWRQLVARMRQMPSSNLTDAEAAEATTCLVYRAFGQQGLSDLATKENHP